MKKFCLLVFLLALAILMTGCACKHETTTLINSVEATCQIEGYTGDTFCTDCEEIIAEGQVIEMPSHTKSEPTGVLTENCTDEGYTGDVYCSECSVLLSSGEAIPAAGHVEGSVVDSYDPTCEFAGYIGDVYCEVCSELLIPGEEIAPLGHSFTAPVNVFDPTCTSEGYTGDRECPVCGMIEYGESIGKSAHEYADDVCGVCGWMRAGLYIDGTLQLTWDQLVENRYVEVSGDTLVDSLESLTGMLVVSDEINYLSVGSWGKASFDNTSLSEVWLPAGVTVIPNFTFNKAAQLKKVHFYGDVTSIGPSAFAECSSLEEFIIPDTVEVLGDQAFVSCSKLSSISIPASVRTIGKNCFASCTALNELPIEEGVTLIDEYAFYNTALRTITLPASVTTLGSGAFSESHVLESIDLSATSIREIGPFTFNECWALYDLKLPETLVSITSKNSLYGTYALRTWILPDSLTYIHPEAVYWWAGVLKPTVQEVVWPVSLLDGSALCGYPSVQRVYYRGSELQWSLTKTASNYEDCEIIFDYSGSPEPIRVDPSACSTAFIVGKVKVLNNPFDRESLGVVNVGNTLEFLQEVQDDANGVPYYKVTYNGQTGWISSRYSVLQ